MRRVTGILIMLAIGFGIYHYFGQSGEAACEKQGGLWDKKNKRCVTDAQAVCAAKGYEWDKEGNRCLIIDYEL